MAEFSYAEHISGYAPAEVFAAASKVASLPSGSIWGFSLEVLDGVDTFDLGVRVQAGIAFDWMPFEIPGEITVFQPPELVKVEAETRLGHASLLLAVTPDQREKGTDITCSLETEPSILGKPLEWLLNPYLDKTLHRYADIYKENVVSALAA